MVRVPAQALEFICNGLHIPMAGLLGSNWHLAVIVKPPLQVYNVCSPSAVPSVPMTLSSGATGGCPQ